AGHQRVPRDLLRRRRARARRDGAGARAGRGRAPRALRGGRRHRSVRPLHRQRPAGPARAVHRRGAARLPGRARGGGEERAMTEFPKLTYDILTVGEEFVSDTHLVTPEDVEAYAYAVEDDHPWYSGPSPFGGPVAHSTLMANQALHLRHGKYIVHAG